jgi:hypothetical protein
MNDALKVSGWTLCIWAISHRLIGIAFNGCAALWTAFWQVIDLFLTCASLYNRLNDLGNNFSCTLYENPVADAQIFALNITFIVECGTRDSDSANIDWFKHCPGIDRASTSNADANVE